MRTKQAALLKKAKKEGLSQAQIEALSRDDVSVEFIQRMYRYLCAQNAANVSKDDTAVEVTRCTDFIEKKKKAGKLSKDEFMEIVYYLFPDKRDDLIGSDKKIKIYYAMKLRNKHDPNACDDLPFDNTEGKLFKIYVDLLHTNIEHKTVKSIIRYLIGETHAIDYAQRLIQNSCIIDDIVHNNKDSFLFLLMEMGKLHGVRIADEQIKSLYDQDKHRFCFDRKTIHKYFIEDNRYAWCPSYYYDEFGVAEMKKKEYPFSGYMIDFCKKSHMKKDGAFSQGDFSDWYTGDLFQVDKLKRLQEAYDLINQEFEVATPAWSLRVKIRTSFFVNIVYNEYNKIRVYGNEYSARSWYATPDSSTYSVNLMITPDGRIFRTYYNPKKRTIPVSMSEILSFLRKGNAFSETIQKVVDFYGRKNRFVYDVIKDCQTVEMCTIPMSFNDVLLYHNKNEFMLAKYKAAREMQVNWNKKNINLSYMIIKAYQRVEPGISQRILCQINDVGTLANVHYRDSLNCRLDRFLHSVLRSIIIDAEKQAQKRAFKKASQYYRNEIRNEVETVILDDELDMWEQDRIDDEFNLHQLDTSISDYIVMCRTTKQKVRLDVRTRQQMNNLHDLAAHGDRDNNTYYRRNTQEVKVPKDSKFSKLRDYLPKDFEWIKSRKRLILETELQHHCVWSYAQKITEDRCAIYSFVDSKAEHSDDGKAKRYTIEFAVDNDGKYSIIQIQGKYDRVHTNNMHTFVQDILESKQKDKKSKKASA